MDVILLGPPGAGKGTQAQVVQQQLGLVHVSSGDLFRAALRQGTELGMLAKSYMDRGELVPDELVIQMIMERIGQEDCAGGVLFDGFPRTSEQAHALDRALAERGRRIDRTLYLSVPDEVLQRRIAGRQTCRACGAVYNVYYFPSHTPGSCDTCGGKLYQRSDDNIETARRRLEVYFAQTLPLIAYYREQGVLAEIDGQQEIGLVTLSMLEALGASERVLGGISLVLESDVLGRAKA
jgi:adenylate kinase